MNKKAIQQTEYVKYLGILIDSRLTFKQHVSAVAKKVGIITGLMFKIRSSVNNATLKMIYFSLIYPHLLYGISIWGNACDSDLKSITTLQKKAVRLIANKENNINFMFVLPGDQLSYWYIDTFIKVPSSPIFYELKILKFQDTYTGCPKFCI